MEKANLGVQAARSVQAVGGIPVRVRYGRDGTLQEKITNLILKAHTG